MCWFVCLVTEAEQSKAPVLACLNGPSQPAASKKKHFYSGCNLLWWQRWKEPEDQDENLQLPKAFGQKEEIHFPSRFSKGTMLQDSVGARLLAKKVLGGQLQSCGLAWCLFPLSLDNNKHHKNTNVSVMIAGFVYSCWGFKDFPWF